MNQLEKIKNKFMRQVFEESIKNILKELSEFIKEYTDFGLEIWVARLKNYDNETSDLPANLLFRQVLEMSDAISELIKVGCVNPSRPLIRSALDCYFQLAYLLKDNEEKKALLFLYHYNHKRSQKLDRMINPEKNNSFNNKLKKDKNLKGFELSNQELRLAKEDFKNLNIALNSKLNENTAQEYGMKKKVWYESLIGGNTIEQLATCLEESGLYELLYRDLSEFSHGTDIIHNNMKVVSETHVGLIALRDISDIKSVVDTTILILERSIRIFFDVKIHSKKEFITKGLELAGRSIKLREREFKIVPDNFNSTSE